MTRYLKTATIATTGAPMPRISVGVLSLLGASLVVLAAQTPAPPSSAERDAAAQAAANAAVPRVALEPGLTPVPDYNQFKGDPPPVTVPDGFTPIFNGRTLDGWHISQVARHG